MTDHEGPCPCSTFSLGPVRIPADPSNPIVVRSVSAGFADMARHRPRTLFFVYARDFHLTENEDEIGFYCGLIGKANLSSFSSSYTTGYSRDHGNMENMLANRVSYYASLSCVDHTFTALASSFFFAQFCTAIFWGYMSDRYGRRPIILLGLCGSAVASILFGLSKSLAWAIVSRSICGFLNGKRGGDPLTVFLFREGKELMFKGLTNFCFLSSIASRKRWGGQIDAW